MFIKTIYRCLIGLALALSASSAAFSQYMPTSSTNIPLSYVSLGDNYFRLAINVGINGGPLRSYLFDTGSPGFNAAYNPTTWNGFGGGSTTTVPASTVPNGNNIQLKGVIKAEKLKLAKTGTASTVPVQFDFTAHHAIQFLNKLNYDVEENS